MTLRPVLARLGVLLLAALALAACAARQAQWARAGKATLVGMSDSDVRVCAGHPANIHKIKNGEVWVYEQKAATPGGIPVVVPAVPGFGFVGGSDGYCRVVLRMVGGKVVEMSYAGATEVWGHRDAACGPIVRTCVERVTGVTR